jgi:hypothetical protein
VGFEEALESDMVVDLDFFAFLAFFSLGSLDSFDGEVSSTEGSTAVGS